MATDRVATPGKATTPIVSTEGSPVVRNRTTSGAPEPPLRSGFVARLRRVRPAPYAGPCDLKAFLAEHSNLLSIVATLTALASFVVSLDLGWLDIYLKALLLTLAVLVYFELHVHLPISVAHGNAAEGGRIEWRLAAFSLLVQLIIFGFVVWAITTLPLLVVPLAMVGVAAIVWRRTALLGHLRPVVLMVTLVAGFLASEHILAAIEPDYVAYFEHALNWARTDLLDPTNQLDPTD